jgi:hypothetical protein
MDTVKLVSAFDGMLHELSQAFTRPTLETFRQLAHGWILTPGVGTVTGILRTMGTQAMKHWTVYEKFFYRAAWSLPDVSRLLLTRLIGPLLNGVVDLNIDDTTCARRGKHVAFAGWFKDASACAQKQVIHWAHNWVVSAVTLRLPQFPNLRLSLPVQAVLYRKRPDCTRQARFATRQQIAARMVREVAEALPGLRIRLAVDGQYATENLLGHLPPKAWAVTRLRKDAALHAPPGPRPKGKRGRKPKKGKRLPTPKRMARRTTGWQAVEILKQGRSVKRHVLGNAPFVSLFSAIPPAWSRTTTPSAPTPPSRMPNPPSVFTTAGESRRPSRNPSSVLAWSAHDGGAPRRCNVKPPWR